MTATRAMAIIRRAIAGLSPGWLRAGRFTEVCIPFSVQAYLGAVSLRFVTHQGIARWESSLSPLVCRCHSWGAGREGCTRRNSRIGMSSRTIPFDPYSADTTKLRTFSRPWRLGILQNYPMCLEAFDSTENSRLPRQPREPQTPDRSISSVVLASSSRLQSLLSSR